jgi:D-threo-aldose 1-dehydrogenase
VLRRFPALRERVKGRQEALHRPARYDAPTALASLETSLRELGTEYVDALFVHDPSAIGQAELGELVPMLEELRERGLIRAWGFSGDPDPCVGLARACGDGALEQLRDDIFAPVPDLSGRQRPALTFGVIAEALPRVRGLVRQDPERWEAWNRATGLDSGDAETLAGLLLRDALDRNRGGGVIFASTHPGRIEAACGIAEEARGDVPDPVLIRFRAELDTTLALGGERAA